MPAQKLFSTLLLVVLTISSNAQKNNPDLSTLDAYIADAIKKFDQPGLAVGVVKDGELVYSNGFGKLDLAKPEPVDTNSIFFI
ncbi:MAG: serine hydrolase domain-containing protein, partial [Flavobacteriales bacterium]